MDLDLRRRVNTTAASVSPIVAACSAAGATHAEKTDAAGASTPGPFAPDDLPLRGGAGELADAARTPSDRFVSVVGELPSAAMPMGSDRPPAAIMGRVGPPSPKIDARAAQHQQPSSANPLA